MRLQLLQAVNILKDSLACIGNQKLFPFPASPALEAGPPPAAAALVGPATELGAGEPTLAAGPALEPAVACTTAKQLQWQCDWNKQ